MQNLLNFFEIIIGKVHLNWQRWRFSEGGSVNIDKNPPTRFPLHSDEMKKKLSQRIKPSQRFSFHSIRPKSNIEDF